MMLCAVMSVSMGLPFCVCNDAEYLGLSFVIYITYDFIIM